MKKMKILSVSFLLFMTLIYSDTSAQDTSFHIYKEWAMLGEGPTQIDVSYRVVKCSSFNQVHLFIFNENPKDQTANFDLEIGNEEGQKFIKLISFPVSKAAMYRAMCDSDSSLNALKIDLPPGYDPNKITVSITFKP